MLLFIKNAPAIIVFHQVLRRTRLFSVVICIFGLFGRFLVYETDMANKKYVDHKLFLVL